MIAFTKSLFSVLKKVQHGMYIYSVAVLRPLCSSLASTRGINLSLQQVRELLSGPCEKCSSSLLADDLAAFLSLILTIIGLKVIERVIIQISAW